MKKTFILFLLLLVSCGPSDQEIQSQIDEAVEEALETTTTSTSLPEKECLEYINSVRNAYSEIGKIFDTQATEEQSKDYELHLAIIFNNVQELSNMSSKVSNINARNSSEVNLLLELENYRSTAFNSAKLGFELLRDIPWEEDDVDKWTDSVMETYKTRDELRIRINNYKCEA